MTKEERDDALRIRRALRQVRSQGEVAGLLGVCRQAVEQAEVRALSKLAVRLRRLIAADSREAQERQRKAKNE